MSLVSVIWGCYNIILQMGGSNNKNLFLIVLKCGESNFKVQVWLGSGEAPFPDLQTATFSPYAGMEQASSYKGTNPIVKTPPS